MSEFNYQKKLLVPSSKNWTFFSSEYFPSTCLDWTLDFAFAVAVAIFCSAHRVAREVMNYIGMGVRPMIRFQAGRADHVHVHSCRSCFLTFESGKQLDWSLP